LIRNGWRSRVAFRKEPLGACARRPFRCRRPTQSGRDRFGIWRQSSRGNSAGCGAAYLSAGSCTVFAPDRRASCGRGLGTRRPRDPDRPLVCQDETSKQLLAETRVPIPIKPARPARCDHEPNGTANLFVMLQRSKAGASPIAPAVDPRAGDYQRMATGCLGCQAKLWSLRESNDA
jgi:hypothetical protein